MRGECTDKQYKIRRRLFGILSLVAFIIITGLLTWLFIDVFSPHMQSTESFREFLDSFGWQGRLILFALQCVQIALALIPGEIIELGAGYAYGAVEGTIICLLGITLSSSAIFLLIKKVGVSLVETIISREKILESRFINTERKLKRLAFLLFFIPGTPKDAFTYLVALTDMKLSTFLSLTLIARIPSVLSSTISGQFLGEKNYVTAIIVYAITAVVSIIGYSIYNYIKTKQKDHTVNCVVFFAVM
jgi:uncharacterized membrane protein YdjX (TVP38/TMEM64 family)